MATKQVTIPEIGPVTLYKRRGNRSLRLSVGLNGEVRVSLPYWVPYRAAEEFARGKVAWITSHRSRRNAVLEQDMRIGKAHRMNFEATLGSKVTTRVLLTEVRVLYPRGERITEKHIQSKAQAAAIRALRQEAEQLLPGRLQALAERHGFHYKSIEVKRLKSRWGSCNSSKEITLNLFLMQLPWHLIDYVLLHELTHTRVMQHGKPFWDELERHLSTARKLRQEINTYQPILSPEPLTVA